MMKLVRWIFPLSFFALGLYLFRLSYRAYAQWQQETASGDISAAEAYEVEFWPEVSLAIFLIFLSAFLAGRWSVRRR